MPQRANGKVVQKGVDVYVLIPPKPFQCGPPLNSTAFLRLKSTEKKHRETLSSISSEGYQIILCLDTVYLKCSLHTISPRKHCHQSPKLLRDKHALTPGAHKTRGSACPTWRALVGSGPLGHLLDSVFLLYTCF